MKKCKLTIRRPYIWRTVNKSTSFKRFLLSRLFRFIQGILKIIDGIISVITLGFIGSEISMDFFFWYTHKEYIEWTK